MIIYITLFIAVAAGIYSYRYVRRAANRRIANIVYLVMGVAALIYALVKTLPDPTAYSFFRAIAIVIIFYACATLPLCLVGLAEDIFSLFKRIFTGKWIAKPSQALFIVACGLAILGLGTLVEGMVRGKTDYRVEPFEMKSERLPAGFEDFRIVQISDLHLGSFDPDDRKLPCAFEIVQELHPDMIVLTGDILNNNSADMLPWMDYLKALDAPKGKFAIVGNHDYCEYDRSLNAEGRREQMDSLFSYYRQAGFKVLDNEYVSIENGGDTIYLAGVENWGVGPFPARGDISKAVDSIPDGKFTILLSHDPAHFEHIVSHYPKFIDLTLSGHTHAMQFAFRFSKNFQWSPIQYRDKYWAGPYRENGRQLYVTRGVGYHFFPARVGMRPEITLITLKKEN